LRSGESRVRKRDATQRDSSPGCVKCINIHAAELLMRPAQATRTLLLTLGVLAAVCSQATTSSTVRQQHSHENTTNKIPDRLTPLNAIVECIYCYLRAAAAWQRGRLQRGWLCTPSVLSAAWR
jgi:hypothetical protein